MHLNLALARQVSNEFSILRRQRSRWDPGSPAVTGMRQPEVSSADRANQRSGRTQVGGSFLPRNAVDHRFAICLSGLTSRRFSGVKGYIEDNDLACYLGSS